MKVTIQDMQLLYDISVWLVIILINYRLSVLEKNAR